MNATNKLRMIVILMNSAMEEKFAALMDATGKQIL